MEHSNPTGRPSTEQNVRHLSELCRVDEVIDQGIEDIVPGGCKPAEVRVDPRGSSEAVASPVRHPHLVKRAKRVAGLSGRQDVRIIRHVGRPVLGRP